MIGLLDWLGILCGRWRREQLSGAREISLAAGAGEQAAVADAVKALGQDVQQEAADELVGGEHLPGDETGDAHLCTKRLQAICTTMGVNFRFGVDVVNLFGNSGRILGATTGNGDVLVADVYFAAMGSYTPALLRPLSLRLLVYPVKGYSLTMDVIDPDASWTKPLRSQLHD